MNLTLLLCVPILALPLAAQRPARAANAEPLKVLLEKYDADHDGAISSKEYTRGTEAFAKLDRNRDGKIDAADLQSAPNRAQRPASARNTKLPLVGEMAPDFTLMPLTPAAPAAAKAQEKATEKEPPKPITLSQFAGKRPVALIFGSYT